jgi:hypothetical protein
VEEEFMRREPTKVRVLDEAARLWAEVVLVEVGQRSVAEAEGDTLALDGLLADTDGHLRDVDERALGASHDHLLDVVVVLQVLLRVLAGVVTRQVELPLDGGLE